jgi:hypothetical protein
MALSLDSHWLKVLVALPIAASFWLVPRAVHLPTPERIFWGSLALGTLAGIQRELGLLNLEASRDRRVRHFQEELFNLQLAKQYEALEGSGQMLALPPAQLDGTTTDALPPLRHLANELAAHDGHTAIVAKTRSGKTTLLIGIIQQAQALGHVVHLVDGKGDARLKALPDVNYIQCNRPERSASTIKLLADLLRELAKRQDGKKGAPITIIIDEHNLILDAVGDAGGKDLAAKYAMDTKRLVLQGASVKIFVRASNHTSRVEDWGWNTGVLDSLSFLALGRNGEYESLEDLIQYQLKGSKKKRLQEELDALRSQSFTEPLALTTMKPLGFCRVPSVQPVLSPVSNEAESATQPLPMPPDYEGIRYQLEWVLNPKESDSHPSNLIELLPTHLAAIVQLSQQKGWLKARDVIQNIRACKAYSSEQIREFFKTLEHLGVGSTRGEGDQVQFSASTGVH